MSTPEEAPPRTGQLCPRRNGSYTPGRKSAEGHRDSSFTKFMLKRNAYVCPGLLSPFRVPFSFKPLVHLSLYHSHQRHHSLRSRGR